MSDNKIIASKSVSIRSIDPTETRLKNMETMLNDGLQRVKNCKPKGLMIIYSDEADGQFIYKYDSTGLKATEKIALLELIKDLILRGE